ncbi:hypothetical protein CAPTEDRAFT_205879 [Capitella teleta]|uniref:Amino acid transporter transmembrane domain-containing protein n=1 Tax=Capitella teleta TaxID=283909 RepID=R7U1Q7_CAPTE|nr:hypothetical protein CAPTEDRAFT_205879 [Capitella teleta]|eukprot:ELT97601.1 hypothetical protein CAPTEDRAFT_205879 [Capitella teleta]
MWFNKIGDLANLCKSIFGTSIFGVPFIFSLVGPVPSIILCIILGVATFHCSAILVECKYAIIEDICQEEEEEENRRWNEEHGMSTRCWLTANISYEDIGFCTMGKYGRWLVKVCLTLTQMGLTVNYMIVSGNAFYDLYWSALSLIEASAVDLRNGTLLDAGDSPGGSSLIVFVLLPFPVYVAMTMVQEIRGLSVISILSLSGLLAGVLIIVIYTALTAIDPSSTTSFFYVNWVSIPAAISQITTAYESIGVVGCKRQTPCKPQHSPSQILSIETSMKGNYSSFRQNLILSLTFFGSLLVTLGCVVYAGYGHQTAQLVFTNLPKGSAVSFLVEAMLLVASILCYPLQVFPAVETVEKLVFPCAEDAEEDAIIRDSKEEATASNEYIPALTFTRKLPTISKTVPRWKHVLVRLAFVTILAFIAVVFRENFVFILSFSGALAFIPLCFVIPSVIHLILLRQKLSILLTFIDISLIFLGIVSSVITIVTVCIELANL